VPSSIADNIMGSYLYGSSQALAVMGDPFWRGRFAHYPTLWHHLVTQGSYLGKAHYLRMKRLYCEANNDPWVLREKGMEMLLGDPFLDLEGLF